MQVDQKALKIIERSGGIIHTTAAIKKGIHPRTLYLLRDTGQLTTVSRGIFRLADLPELAQPDIATVAARVPHAVICLVSALSFHNLTTQRPATVSIAIASSARSPRIDFPPLSVFRFSEESLSAGVEEHLFDGIAVRIFSPEKTIADCLKFRNKIGFDIFTESLKLYRTRRRFDIDALLRYGRICRVERLMKPYLEALL